MISRDDFGSWLDGPSAASTGNDYPGSRLGLPETGPGSIAPMWRRLLALWLDYLMCLGIAYWLFNGSTLAILGIFFIEYVVLDSLLGTTVGQRLFGIRVIRLDGARPGFASGFIRSLLLMFVIPAIIFDADRRGFHDIPARTAVVRG
ncbi:RDD family protein [Brevibacterium otitidis]|uniref:RDD family protein n=1 Tax=Brevibacterium otitidis TaxID=53364 RepID=A0ABV5WY76_9MICO|nr:RDD family protein [Brevibacterium otitidis]